jgi:hypothetical protein
MPAKNPPVKRAESPSKPGDERVTQFSIFLPNKVGKFLNVVKLLNEHHIHVLATSIEPSADTAIVRIVVSDPESVEGVFHLSSIPYSTCPLLVVELRQATQLGDMLAALLAAEVNIFGSYALLTRPHGHAALALHVEDNDCALHVLHASGFQTLGQEDISR